MLRVALALGSLLALACSSAPSGVSPHHDDAGGAVASAIEAGFLDVPSRDVTLKGQPVHIAADARLFYNFRAADEHPETRPVIFLFNGFAAEIVRAFGTGPTTVAEGGAVVPNPASLARFANLVYLEPRQAGYSYDVARGRAPAPSDCASAIFNEYVDAADVLFAALAFLDAHPALRGPVYWLGESYAGVRVTWILAYLRGRWDLASYSDPALAARIAGVHRASSLHAGQILLEAWLAGGAHAAAIDRACSDAFELAAVSASVGAPCAGSSACDCAASHDRSAYNFAFTNAQQTARETEASLAHVLPDRAAALLGVPLTAIAGLGAAERATGFKCSTPDASVPAQDALVGALGALPPGQSYYVPYSPLLPGKETAPTTLDWRTASFEGVAFVDNLHEVPAFSTDGRLDLVVPARALAPALGAVVGADRVDVVSPTRLGVRYGDGERFITIGTYASAGHMVTMLAADAFARDLETWLASNP